MTRTTSVPTGPRSGAAMPGRETRFDRHYGRLDRGQGPRDEANRARLARTLALVPESTATALDVGGGAGAVSGSMAAGGIEVAVADISLRALRLATVPRIAATATLLPFGDRAFDLVLALEMLEHLPDPVFAEARRELARVAAEHILVSTPNREHLPSGMARCPACGAVFHRNLHFQSLSHRDHEGLFSDLGFEAARTVGVDRWRQSARWTAVRRLVGGALAYKPVLVCPRCGAGDEMRAGGEVGVGSSARRLALRGVDAVGWRAVRPTDRWLVTLYRRTNGSGSDPTAKGEALPERGR